MSMYLLARILHLHGLHSHSQSLVNLGEMWGMLVAQLVGDPGTQMTVNTFHYAGENVTLCVPCLKEIIDVTSNVQTPSLGTVEETFSFTSCRTQC